MFYPNAYENSAQFQCPVNWLMRLSNNCNIDLFASSSTMRFKIYLNNTQFTYLNYVEYLSYYKNYLLF